MLGLLNPWLWLGAVGVATAIFTAGCTEGAARERAAWDAERAELNEIAIEQSELARRAERLAAVSAENIRKDYADRLLVSDSARADALDELRRQARLRARAPAATAPAECRNYAASPADVPLRDQEFFLGLAARADRVVVQLNAAQRYIEAIHEMTRHATAE